MELLQYAFQQGILNLDDVRDNMRKKEREKILSMHKYAVFQDKDGRWKTTLPDETKKKGRRLIAKKEKEDLENKIIAHYEGKRVKKEDAVMGFSKPRQEITLSDIYPKWLEYKANKTRATSYIKRIHQDWKAFYLHDEIIVTPLVKLTRLYLDNWVHKKIKEKKLTKKKFYNMAVILRQCLEYACEEDIGILASNPMNRVKINCTLFCAKAKPERETQVYLKSEQSKIAELVWQRYNKRKTCTTPLAILFNFQVGLRIGELVAVKWEDINGRWLHVRRSEVRVFDVMQEIGDESISFSETKIVDYVKTSAGNRKVYLNENALEILDLVKKARNISSDAKGYIFLALGKDSPLVTASINHYIRSLCCQANIQIKTNHKIRKTFISSLFDANINVDTIRRLAGHEDEKTSLNNYCFDQTDEKELNMVLESVKNTRFCVPS